MELIDESLEKNNPFGRELSTFAPRLWRVNEELTRKFFKYECESETLCSVRHHPFCKANWKVPYNVDEFFRWFSVADLKEINEWYWGYIEYCETIRGEAATKCRSKESTDYLPPFPLEHFQHYKVNFFSAGGTLGR
jgi:hypothetical protein